MANDNLNVEAEIKYLIDSGEKRLIYIPSEVGNDDSK